MVNASASARQPAHSQSKRPKKESDGVSGLNTTMPEQIVVGTSHSSEVVRWLAFQKIIAPHSGRDCYYSRNTLVTSSFLLLVAMSGATIIACCYYYYIRIYKF